MRPQSPAYATPIPQTYPGGNAPEPDDEESDDALDHFDAERFHPDVLRTAKHGLMAACLAETPREFLLACSQACAPILAVGGARSAMTLLRSMLGTAGSVADGFMDTIDPTVLVTLAESLGLKGDALDPIKAFVTDAVARKAAEKAASQYVRCGTAGCYPPSAGVVQGADPDGVFTIRPITMVTEYADRTEFRVVLKGADGASVKCTKSDSGYFVEAPTSLPVAAFTTSIIGGVATMPVGTVLKYRGTIPTHSGLCGGELPAGEPTVTWDAATESLVLTFARQNVVPVPISVPPQPAAMNEAAWRERTIDAILGFSADVGFDVPGGVASDAAGKAAELRAHLTTLTVDGLCGAYADVVARMLAAHPERSDGVKTVSATLFAADVASLLARPIA